MENVLSARTSLAQCLASTAESQVSYLQWAIMDKEHKNDPNGKTFQIPIKKEFQTTQEELLEQLNLLLHRFKRHTFNIKNQFTHYRALRQGLKVHECLIHVDFYENCLCKYTAMYRQSTSEHHTSRQHCTQVCFMCIPPPARCPSAKCPPQDKRAHQQFGSTCHQCLITCRVHNRHYNQVVLSMRKQSRKQFWRCPMMYHQFRPL